MTSPSLINSLQRVKSLELVAIKKEKWNENVAIFFSFLFFLPPPIGARKCCHGDNICWVMSDKSQERSVLEREHLKLKKKKVVREKSMQAVLLNIVGAQLKGVF